MKKLCFFAFILPYFMLAQSKKGALQFSLNYNSENSFSKSITYANRLDGFLSSNNFSSNQKIVGYNIDYLKFTKNNKYFFIGLNNLSVDKHSHLVLNTYDSIQSAVVSNGYKLLGINGGIRAGIGETAYSGRKMRFLTAAFAHIHLNYISLLPVLDTHYPATGSRLNLLMGVHPTLQFYLGKIGYIQMAVPVPIINAQYSAFLIKDRTQERDHSFRATVLPIKKIHPEIGIGVLF